MIELLRALPPERYQLCGLVLAETDVTSQARAAESGVRVRAASLERERADCTRCHTRARSLARRPSRGPCRQYQRTCRFSASLAAGKWGSPTRWRW